MALTMDKARIAQQFAWERSQCKNDEQLAVLDSMLKRLALTIFGNRSRIQRNEFLRYAKYRQPLASVTELYERYLQGHESNYLDEVK